MNFPHATSLTTAILEEKGLHLVTGGSNINVQGPPVGVDLKTFVEGQECCCLIKHGKLEYFGKTLQEGDSEHRNECRHSVILKMRMNTGLPMENEYKLTNAKKKTERKNNNSREPLFL